MEKKPRFIFHPILFALYPTLFLYSHNIEKTFLHQTFLPAGFTLGFTVLVWSLAGFITRSSAKGGVITSIGLILFFSYSHVYDTMETLAGGFTITGGKNKYLVVVWGILFLYAAYGFSRTRKNLSTITRLFNNFASILIILSFLNLGLYKLETGSSHTDQTGINQDLAGNGPMADSAGTTRFPDIYYIILDAYGSLSTLKDYYGYDNSEFMEYLKEKGFFIGKKSRSNYATTFLSLASSLNMEYIGFLTQKVGADTSDRNEPYQMIKKNQVARFLKTKGYRFVHFSSGWGATDTNPLADQEFHCAQGSEFLWTFIQTSFLRPFEPYLNLIGDDARSKILCTFSTLGKIARDDRPSFVFSHIVIPHAPYIFGRNGEPVEQIRMEMASQFWQTKDLYVDQLRFANKLVKELIDSLLSRPNPPIIILHSDHGPGLPIKKEDFSNPEFLKARMRILNAYFLPDRDPQTFYDAITPVNTFRVLFNLYFDAGMDLLEDQVYFSSHQYPYRFKNVTETANYG